MVAVLNPQVIPHRLTYIYAVTSSTMPQQFQILRCFKCSTFQVHQVKKSIRWECKVCCEKQSVKRNYGIGTGRECRLHVQTLNALQGEASELASNNADQENIVDDSVNLGVSNTTAEMPTSSKWYQYVDTELEQATVNNENMTLGGAEVVLELPTKRRKPSKDKTNLLESKKLEGSLNAKKSKAIQLTSPQVYSNRSLTHINNKETFSETPKMDTQSLALRQSVVLSNLHGDNGITRDNKIKLNIVSEEPKVPTNSKWAQFVEDSPDVDCESGNPDEDAYPNSSRLCMGVHDIRGTSKGVTALFSDCNDDDFDQLLDL